MDFDTARKLPPQSIESEMSILGAVFIANEAIDTVHEIMSAADFYRESHRKIFLVMSHLADKREPIDLITVISVLRDRGELEEVGGGAYLAILVDYVPLAANVAHYCRIVADKAAERRLITNAQDAIALAYQGGNLEEAAAKLEIAIQPSGQQKGAPVSIQQSLSESIKRISERYENRGKITGISYAIPDLD
jgi:replicative DNA helicase